MQPAKLWLSRYAKFLVVYALFLITVGGTVTTHKAGLSVPDWPTSFGHNMFTLPFHLWKGDVLLEHSHRLIGSVMGMLVIGLFLWTMKVERRQWVGRLTWLALVLVIIQGIMGGLRVTERSIAWAIIHGCTAQAFLCLLLLIAAVLSPEWTRPLAARADPARIAAWRPWAWVVVGAVFVQLVLGALVRHLEAGLAIPTFPLTPEGGFMPAVHSLRTDIHFTHRFWALVVAILVGVLVTKVIRASRADRRFLRPAVALAALLVVQILLGATIIWSRRAFEPTTLHVVNGAVVLAVSFLLGLRANHFAAKRNDQSFAAASLRA